jgi:hypothetical protein
VVCSWGHVSAVWCCPFFRDGWSSFVCIWISRLVFQRSPVLFLWLPIIVKWIFKKRMRAWSGLIWLRTERSDGLLWTWQWTFGLHKMWAGGGTAEELLVSQQVVCFFQLEYIVSRSRRRFHS